MQQIPEHVREIMERLEGAGYEAWCVGGAVRDILLGRTPGDWDVTTNALPETVMELFAPGALPTGLQHGTVTVGGGRGVEVTTYRRDGTYQDNRHPDHVEFTASLREDLSRRDFTINAMALDLRGTLYDPFGGQADLTAGIIRAVGVGEKRFGEDALRILRGLRFSARLGFPLDKETAAAARCCRELLHNIAPERIREELTGLLCGEHVAQVLLRYPDVLGTVLPEILPCVGFDQRNRHHCYDVWEHTVRSVEAVPPTPVLRWTMLFHDLGKPESFTLGDNGQGHFYGHWRGSVRLSGVIMERLRFDNHSRKNVLTLVEWHDCPMVPLEEKMVRRRLRQLGEETLRALLAVKRADNLAQAPAYRNRQNMLREWEAMLDQVLEQDACFSLKQMHIKGNDITALGVEGPRVGEILNAILDQVVEGKLPNDREALLTYVKEELL